jgi:hypothetical protein
MPAHSRALDPLLRRERETVQPGLHFNPVEFDGIKRRVVEPLPDPEKLHGIPVSEPVADEVVRRVRVLVASDVGEADEVVLPLGNDAHSDALDLDGGFDGFFHEVRTTAFAVSWWPFSPARLLIVANSPELNRRPASRVPPDWR